MTAFPLARLSPRYRGDTFLDPRWYLREDGSASADQTRWRAGRIPEDWPFRTELVLEMIAGLAGWAEVPFAKPRYPLS